MTIKCVSPAVCACTCIPVLDLQRLWLGRLEVHLVAELKGLPDGGEDVLGAVGALEHMAGCREREGEGPYQQS